MTIRTRRRSPGSDVRLEARPDKELAEIAYFGCLMKHPHTVRYQASPEEQERAWKILRERRDKRSTPTNQFDEGAADA